MKYSKIRRCVQFLFLMYSPLLVQVGCAQEATGAPPSMDEILAMTNIGGIDLSPNGSEIAYVLSRRESKGQALDSTIYVVSTNTGQERRLTEGDSPAWSPDGSKIAYLSFGSGSQQIWTIPAVGGTAEQLTHSDDFIDRFRWAPDSKYIAFQWRELHFADLTKFATAADPTAPIIVDVNNLPVNRLSVVNLETKNAQVITSESFSVGGYEQWFPDTFSWSPDSKSIAFSKRPHAKAGSHLFGDVMTIGRDGNEPRMLVEREGMDGYPKWSPDGRHIAFISTERNDWVTISYLYLVNVDTLELRKITPEFDEKIKEFFWAAQGERIVYIAGDRIGSQIYSVDVDAGQVRPLTEGTDFYNSLSVSEDGKSLAFLRENAYEAADVYFTRLDDIKPKRMTDVNPQVKSWTEVETKIIRWRSFDGMEIEGIVHMPLNYKDGKRYPLLVIPHGGPHSVMVNSFPRPDYRLFSQQGWVVFRPNFRGSGSYGEKFLRANLMSWGVGDYADVMSGVDYLIEDGLVDAAKMGMAGASYGGYMTSWTISQTDRFKAAVAGVAVTDLPSFVRTTDVPERFESYLGKDQRRHFRSSPMYFADDIKTPTLVWHNSADYRVPLMQGRYLYTALLKNDVPTEFIIYPGESHGMPANERDLLMRKIRWLTSWVIDGRKPEPLPPQ